MRDRGATNLIDLEKGEPPTVAHVAQLMRGSAIILA